MVFEVAGPERTPAASRSTPSPMSSAEQVVKNAFDIVDGAVTALYDDLHLSLGDAAVALISTALRELRAGNDPAEVLCTYRDALTMIQADLAEWLGEGGPLTVY
jgi:hypothetical protein